MRGILEDEEDRTGIKYFEIKRIIESMERMLINIKRKVEDKINLCCKEEKVLINNDSIITSSRRIYVKVSFRYDNQILFRILNREFPNSLKDYKDKIYIYEYLGNNLEGLVEAAQETNMFMLYLIENSTYNFFEALRRCRTKISQKEADSLFEPVFQRYKHLKKEYENLEKIRLDILNSRYPNFRKIKKITL